MSGWNAIRNIFRNTHNFSWDIAGLFCTRTLEILSPCIILNLWFKIGYPCTINETNYMALIDHIFILCWKHESFLLIWIEAQPIVAQNLCPHWLTQHSVQYTKSRSVPPTYREVFCLIREIRWCQLQQAVCFPSWDFLYLFHTQGYIEILRK